MRRILWVTPIEPCFDAGGGGQIRQAHLLDAVAERFEVDLLLTGELRDDRIRSRVRSVTEVGVSPAPDPARRMRRRLRDIRWQIFQRQPDEVARHRVTRRALALEIRRRPEPDIVCIEYVGLAPLLPRRHRALWALTLHNLTSGMARHSARIAPGRRQRLMLGLEARNSRRIESWAARAYDLVVTPSPEDAAALPGTVHVVPNGVETERFRPSPVPPEPRVVFTGALHTLPNRDGIVWFCSEVWPAVRARVPGASLAIVGAEPPSEVLALAARDGVEVHADVPDVMPFLERARVAVVPLRIGTGSRLKALEAMAAARPVVGTTIGLAGLQTRPGDHLLIADEAPAMAEAVARCLMDAVLSARLGSSGRKLVEERYAWSQIGASYARLLEEQVAARLPESPRSESVVRRSSTS